MALEMNDVGLKYSSPGDILAHSQDSIIVTVPFMAATVDHTFFIATRSCRITMIKAVNRVVGGAGATATIEKCTGTVAPGSGTDVHSVAIDGTLTADTVQTPTLATSLATLTLAVGDRLALDIGGTLTGLVGIIVVELQPL